MSHSSSFWIKKKKVLKEEWNCNPFILTDRSWWLLLLCFLLLLSTHSPFSLLPSCFSLSFLFFFCNYSLFLRPHSCWNLKLLCLLLFPLQYSSPQHVNRASQVALVVKNLPAGDKDSVPGSERSPGGGHGNPLLYSCLENSMDRGALTHLRNNSFRSSAPKSVSF